MACVSNAGHRVLHLYNFTFVSTARGHGSRWPTCGAHNTWRGDPYSQV